MWSLKQQSEGRDCFAKIAVSDRFSLSQSPALSQPLFKIVFQDYELLYLTPRLGLAGQPALGRNFSAHF